MNLRTVSVVKLYRLSTANFSNLLSLTFTSSLHLSIEDMLKNSSSFMSNYLSSESEKPISSKVDSDLSVSYWLLGWVCGPEPPENWSMRSYFSFTLSEMKI